MITTSSYCHLHEIWQIEPWLNRPFLYSSIQLCFCAGIVQTNIVAYCYYAQEPPFQPCFVNNDSQQASLLDKPSSDQHNKSQHSIGVIVSSSGGMFFHHDRHIPGQRADRYRDNKPSKSRACWFFLKIVPHFVYFHYYCTTRFRFLIVFSIKIPHPFQYCGSRETLNNLSIAFRDKLCMQRTIASNLSFMGFPLGVMRVN